MDCWANRAPAANLLNGPMEAHADADAAAIAEPRAALSDAGARLRAAEGTPQEARHTPSGSEKSVAVMPSCHVWSVRGLRSDFRSYRFCWHHAPAATTCFPTRYAARRPGA